LLCLAFFAGRGRVERRESWGGDPRGGDGWVEVGREGIKKISVRHEGEI
jgi:hypothetical protein